MHIHERRIIDTTSKTKSVHVVVLTPDGTPPHRREDVNAPGAISLNLATGEAKVSVPHPSLHWNLGMSEDLIMHLHVALGEVLNRLELIRLDRKP